MVTPMGLGRRAESQGSVATDEGELTDDELFERVISFSVGLESLGELLLMELGRVAFDFLPDVCP